MINDYFSHTFTDWFTRTPNMNWNTFIHRKNIWNQNAQFTMHGYIYVCGWLNAWENARESVSNRSVQERMIEEDRAKIDAQHIQRHVIFMVINISCIQHWINIESKPLFVPVFMIWSVPNRIFVLRCVEPHSRCADHIVYTFFYHAICHIHYIFVYLNKCMSAEKKIE